MKSCRLKILATAAVFAGAVALTGPPAWAANLDAGLELDGNILNDGNIDWEDLFEVLGPVTNVPTPVSPLPAGFGIARFVRDFVPGKKGPDETTFATGSKDTLNIDGVPPGWQCNKDNNVIDKNDLVNVYAAVFIDPVGGDVILYFALERYANEGEANVGFWFNQDGTIGCVIAGKTGDFTGDHMDMDLNIFAEFESGGDDVAIVARQWSGGAGGFLDPTILASGGECDGSDGGLGVAGDICGNANNEAPLFGFGPATDIPWLTETKQPGPSSSNDLNEGEFFEGAVNLTQAGLVACFASFLGDSRSSNSLTADLKDYALDDFPLCSVVGDKQCSADPDPGFCLISDAVCTVANEGTDCPGAGDRCIDVNPYIDADGLTIVMENDVTITNDGIAKTFDAAFKENTTFLAGPPAETCDITAVNGVAVSPVDLTDNGWHRVPVNGTDYTVQELAAGESVTATITCETERNPFPNQVDIRTASADEGTPDLFVLGVDLDTESDACTVVPNPMIGLAKSCIDVRLMTMGSELVVEVITEITVSNTGIEVLDPVTVTDSVGGTLTSTLVLAPGASASFLVTDQPSAPGQSAVSVCSDNGAICNLAADCGDPATATCDATTDKFVSSSASFANTVNASGIGAISGSTANATPATADCDLCPTID